MIVDSIGYAATLAGEADCDDLIIAGDLFDTAKPTPQMVGAVVRALAVRAGDTALLVGNHDLHSTAAYDHAMGSLWEFAEDENAESIYTVSQPAIMSNGSRYSIIMIPFRPGDAREWLRPAIAEAHGTGPMNKGEDERTALVIHLGIYSDDYTAFVGGDKSRDAVPVGLLSDLMEEFEIDACFAGNWHARKEFKSKTGKPIIQLGALCPTGWGNKGLRGFGMYFWDTETNAVEFREVAGPRFVDLPYGREGQLEMIEKLKAEPKANRLFVRGRVDTREEMLDLADRVKAIGATCDISVDQTVAKANAKSAAVVARSATTRTKALESYVGTMDLNEDIERGEILERCTSYLTSG